MKRTYEKLRQERDHLVTSIEAADKTDPGGLIASAFQRALKWIDEHPVAPQMSPAAELLHTRCAVINSRA